MSTTITRLRRSVHLRKALFLSVLLFVSLWQVLAMAAGRVSWKATTVKERTDNGSWRLDIEIVMPKAPDVASVPMKFEFQPVAYYERSLNDGNDKPQERTVPLTNQQALIESVDVGFMDPGSGQIQTRTKFSFKVTRAHGYEAGEYKVTIRDTRNGQVVGVPSTLRFQGENEVIDRRSMVFQPSDRKKKEKEEKKESLEAAPEATPADSMDSSASPSSDAPPEASADAPPPVEGRPGGGCHHGPSHGEHFIWVVFASLLTMGVWLRRKA